VSDRTPETALFELALYLVACARLVVDENLGLASFRLTEAASRLIAAAPELGLDPDPFLEAERSVIDTEKLRCMHDLDGYVGAIEEIQARFVAEAKRRAPASTSPRVH
jgi:hypothetical protein